MPKPLPPFKKMWQNFPAGSSEQVKNDIGGRVDAAWIGNTCSIRLSRALNYSGHPIVRDRAGLNTVSGADAKWYGYRVREMEKYLRATYGKPDIEVSAKGTSDLRAAVLGHRGVIMFDVSGWEDATGHVDMWDGKNIRYSEYFDQAKRVCLWKCS
eukprot:gene2333-8058_t